MSTEKKETQALLTSKKVNAFPSLLNLFTLTSSELAETHTVN